MIGLILKQYPSAVWKKPMLRRSCLLNVTLKLYSLHDIVCAHDSFMMTFISEFYHPPSPASARHQNGGPDIRQHTVVHNQMSGDMFGFLQLAQKYNVETYVGKSMHGPTRTTGGFGP